MAQSSIADSTKVPVQAYGVLAMGILAVSLGSIFIRLAQAENVPSLFIAAARLSIASLILTPFVLRRYLPHIRQLSRSDLLLAGVSGLFLAIHFAAWVSSLEYTSVLISVVLVNTNPLWAGILEVLFLKVSLSRNVKLGLAIAFVGGILIAIPATGEITLGQNPLLGALLSIVGAITVSVYFVIGRKLRAQLPLLPYIWLVYSCASVLSLVVVLFSGISVTGYSGDAYLWLVMMALIPQLVGHSSLNYALGYLPATIVTLCIQMEPLLSGFFALVLFSERPGMPQVVGSLIILLGIILASLRTSKST
jgi:drug/metabolite transporter (DMT)-like permease